MGNDTSNKSRQSSGHGSSGPEKATSTMETDRNMKNVGIHGSKFADKTGKD